MPDGLYDRDALAWSEQQAALLARLRDGERVNAAIDWTHVIEEIEDVGLSGLRACRSLLRQALIHLLKLHAWPTSLSVHHWREETIVLLADAQDAFALSMRQRIDVGELFDRARSVVVAAGDDSGGPRPVGEICPFTLDDLLAADTNIDALAARLRRDP